MSGPPPRASTGREPPSAAYAGALYERHRAAVYAFCLYRLRDHEEACDAVQETFTKAWIAVRAGQQVAQPRPWLLTIARNVCIDRARALRARPAFAQLTDLPEAAGRPPPDDLADLSAAVRTLPERQRRAFVLRVVLGWSYKEIAEVVGGSHASVAALVGRSRRAVAKRLSGGGRRVGAVIPVPLLWRWTLRSGAASTMTVAGAANVVALVAVSAATALAGPVGAAPSVAAASPAAVRAQVAVPAVHARVHRSTATSSAPAAPVAVSPEREGAAVSAHDDRGTPVIAETAPAAPSAPADDKTVVGVGGDGGVADPVAEQLADTAASEPVAMAAAVDRTDVPAEETVDVAGGIPPSDDASIEPVVGSQPDAPSEEVESPPSDPTCQTGSHGNGPPPDPGWQGNGNGPGSQGNGPPADPGWQGNGPPCDPGWQEHGPPA